jgi:hypothetical protein
MNTRLQKLFKKKTLFFLPSKFHWQNGIRMTKSENQRPCGRIFQGKLWLEESCFVNDDDDL